MIRTKYSTGAGFTSRRDLAKDVRPTGPTGSHYRLILEDHFDVFNTNTWNYGWPWSPDPINGELQFYDDGTIGGHVVVNSGGNSLLQLIAKDVPDPYGWYDYTSGAINSRDKFWFTYGVFECRAKAVGTQGFWPALWLNPQANGVWPPEIDLLELVGDEPQNLYQNVHWLDESENHQSDINAHNDGTDWTAGFHIYTVEWTSAGSTFWIDGVETHQVLGNSSTIPFNLMLNLAVGGNWPGPPDGTTVWPGVFEVDYVRVWQGPGSPAPPPAPPSTIDADAETGDETQLDSTTTTGSNTFLAQNSTVIAGSYSYEADFDGSTGDCYATDALDSPITDFIVEFKLRRDSTFSIPAWSYGHVAALLDGSTVIAAVKLYSNGGTLELSAEQWQPSWANEGLLVANFAADTNYKIKMRYYSHASSGVIEWWIDDVKQQDVTGLNTSANSGDGVWVGYNLAFAGNGTPTGGSLFIDDIQTIDP